MNIITILLSIIALARTLTPEILELELQIAELEARNQELKYARCRNTHPHSYQEHSIEVSESPLSFAAKCSFNESQLETFFMQSSTEIYLLVNYPALNLTKIYNSECLHLSTL